MEKVGLRDMRMMNISKKNKFLEEFAKLCEEYDATLDSTIDDDGIHIHLDEDKIFTGFLWVDAPETLRAAKSLF